MMCVYVSAFLTLPSSGPAQHAERINVYRYILDIEPPESPAFAVLDVAPTFARAATAPKPLAWSALLLTTQGADVLRAVAVDVSPYFLVGGGIRTRASYTSNTLAGRLKRVGTKTILSVGLLDDDAHTRVAFALRATLHDPHDPINNSALVDQLAPYIRGLPLQHEDVSGEHAAVPAFYAQAAREMLARRRWIVSAGYGFDKDVSSIEPDTERLHALWNAWQYTLGARFDIVLTGQALFGEGVAPDFRGVASLRRKYGGAALLLEGMFTSAAQRVKPGIGLQSLIAKRTRASVVVQRARYGSFDDDSWQAAFELKWSAGN